MALRMPRRPTDPSTPTPRLHVRTAIVPTVSQSVALTRAGIPATTPALLRAAPPEAVRDFLRDPANGPAVLFAHDAGVERLLQSHGIPYRKVRP
jgi:hypothetical protein